MRSALLVLALAACGHEPGAFGSPDAAFALPDGASCATSYMTYENFGEPFIANWCQGCHSAALPVDMRQGSPADVNFDSLSDVQSWAPQIAICAAGDPSLGQANGCKPLDPTSTEPPMPPSGGPPADDRALLAEWITCGTH